jgi:2-polyprenyl-3-methyl-5-hydroxy-6-metoxy-1,4-benzoquinol methylase
LLKYLKPHSNILEIGFGPGALALWLTELGHKVTCIEPAERPAEKAKNKGLTVHTVRFQDYSLVEKYDAIVAMTSLIHIPKIELKNQIERILAHIKPEGLFFCNSSDTPPSSGI